MWRPKIINKAQVKRASIESVMSGSIPVLIIRGFLDKKSCHTAVKRINDSKQEGFQGGKSKHIGPFLMSYATKKQKYFEQARKSKNIFKKIFVGIRDPALLIHETINCTLPRYSLSRASEFQNDYSPYVIRIHEKGRSIPIHKDNIRYEGKEYRLSNVDNQLSCIVHLQESEKGGDLVIYNKQWKKEDEKYRDINFGYSSDLITSTKSCKISNFKIGDLVIINPSYYHEVTKIKGETPRITLGMFLGIYRKKLEMISWA